MIGDAVRCEFCGWYNGGHAWGCQTVAQKVYGAEMTWNGELADLRAQLAAMQAERDAASALLRKMGVDIRRADTYRTRALALVRQVRQWRSWARINDERAMDMLHRRAQMHIERDEALAERDAYKLAHEAAAAALTELYDALVRYEWYAEGEAPPKHIAMMRRAYSALHPEPPHA